jgi:uncharacterized membrane protein
MSNIQQSIEVQVPVTTAYNQWTQFEEFPRFMDGVKEVRQLTDKSLEWTAEINGKEETWTADITEQEPDQVIAWKSTSEPVNSGRVSFARLDENRTRVDLQMEWQPRDSIEKMGAAMGFDDRQIKGDLERFKKFIESRGTETGAWRGEIEQGERVG